MSEFRVMTDRENVQKIGTTGKCTVRAVISDFYNADAKTRHFSSRKRQYFSYDRF